MREADTVDAPHEQLVEIECAATTTSKKEYSVIVDLPGKASSGRSSVATDPQAGG
jgi:hypothetical protein